MAVQPRWYQISKSSSDPLQRARAVKHTRSSDAQDCKHRCSICIIAKGLFPRGVEEVTVVVIQPGPGLRKQVTLRLSIVSSLHSTAKKTCAFRHTAILWDPSPHVSCVSKNLVFQRIEFHIDASIYSDIDILSTVNGPVHAVPLTCSFLARTSGTWALLISLCLTLSYLVPFTRLFKTHAGTSQRGLSAYHSIISFTLIRSDRDEHTRRRQRDYL